MTTDAYLYRITNTVNNMVYIGVTKNPHSRMCGHSSNTTSTKSIIKNAITKHGRDKFNLEVLVKASQEYCYALERAAIEVFNTLKPNGYNICTGGIGAIGIFGEANGMFGRVHSKETKDKMSLRHKGQKASEETKAKMRAAHLGFTHPADSKARIGHPQTPESIEKLRATRKAQWQDPAYRAKMYAAGFGVVNKELRKDSQ